jgi:hypothetical protein
MKKFFIALLLLIGSVSANAEIVSLPIPGAPGLSVTVGTGVNALPLQEIKNNPNAVNITMGDDSWANVPLGFDFPFFGRTFNNSWAMTNGMVTFQDPTVSGIWGACCSGVNLSTERNPAWNYSIFAVHTDLYSWQPDSQYYLRENNSMTYGWYNLSQCCSSAGGNSFEIKINSAGVVDTRIAGAMVQWNAVTSGMSGDLTRGEYFQYYHGSGWNITSSAGAVSWNTAGGFTGADACTTNPLSSPTCPGYTAAQCTISALYNPSCPGYQQAYYTQQCTLNSLYDVNCPGYAQAYLSYQCSANPLYSTTCEGYESAYFNQQCSANALYSTSCPGYDEAYFTQQCSINGLYSTTCPNYASAYFNQQCSLNGLYNTRCPNYAEAYATQQALLRVNTPTTTTTTNTTTTPTVSTSTTSEPAAVAVVSDPVVNDVVTSTATSASPATAATATVPLVTTTTTTTTTAAVEAVAATTSSSSSNESKKEEKSASTSETTSTQSTSTASTSTTSDTKTEAKPTARQELQQRRVAAARAKAVEDGKNLAGNMGKLADMESQKQVQNVVIAAMGYTPGFDAYGKVMMQDVVGYKPYVVYANQKNVDNKRLSWGLMGPSDKLHSELVDSQYNRGN